MSWLPVSQSPIQYVDSNGDPYSGAVLKFYASGTTTNISLATDSTGGTTATDVALNASGYPESSGSIIIPHIDQAYKLVIYPTQAAADADTGALVSIDGLNAAIASATDLDTKVAISSNDTTPGFLNGKLTASDGIELTEGSDGGDETLDIGFDGNLAFPATQVPSADANTLDDYEEGTWTPALSDGSTNATTTIEIGTYTKIGRMVNFQLHLAINSVAALTGGIQGRITGLPFTSNSTTNYKGVANCGYYNSTNLPAAGLPHGRINENSTIIFLYEPSGISGSSALTIAEISDGAVFMMEGSYIV